MWLILPHVCTCWPVCTTGLGPSCELWKSFLEGGVCLSLGLGSVLHSVHLLFGGLWTPLCLHDVGLCSGLQCCTPGPPALHSEHALSPPAPSSYVLSTVLVITAHTYSAEPPPLILVTIPRGGHWYPSLPGTDHTSVWDPCQAGTCLLAPQCWAFCEPTGPSCPLHMALSLSSELSGLMRNTTLQPD